MSYIIRFRGFAGNWEAGERVYDVKDTADLMAERLRRACRGLEVEVLSLDGLTDSGVHYLGIGHIPTTEKVIQ